MTSHFRYQNLPHRWLATWREQVFSPRPPGRSVCPANSERLPALLDSRGPGLAWIRSLEWAEAFPCQRSLVPGRCNYIVRILASRLSSFKLNVQSICQVTLRERYVCASPVQCEPEAPWTTDVSPGESEGVCFYRRWVVCLCVCVCLSVTTITKKIVDGFVSNFMGRFLGVKGRLSSCFVTIGRGMWK